MRGARAPRGRRLAPPHLPHRHIHRSLFVKLSREDMRDIVSIPEVRAALEVRSCAAARRCLPARSARRARADFGEWQVVVKRYKVDLRSVLLLSGPRSLFQKHLRAEFAEENIEVMSHPRPAPPARLTSVGGSSGQRRRALSAPNT
jgi:hypothetical protein